jgi:hypothetical protein
MYNTHDIYWKVVLDYIIYKICVNKDFETYNRKLLMCEIAKEMIIRGEY